MPAPAPARTSPSRPTSTISMKPLDRRTVPYRIMLYAVEGFGKTTFGAFCPKPFIVMAGSETGYDVLHDHGLVPSIPGARVSTFSELLATLDSLSTDRGDVETVVIDSLSTAESMLMDEVCEKHFGGDWGPQGFQSYGKGYGTTETEWLKFIARLDRLWQRGCNVVMLAHTAVRSFTNPEGADYKRYTPDLYDSERASVLRTTTQFADAVLFGNFLTVVDVSKEQKNKNVAEQRGKGTAGTTRVVRTERRDAWDAKNRYGMPDTIDIPNDPTQMAAAIWSHIKKEQA